MERAPQGPLVGLKVIDAATLFAGPQIATMLGDFGADVIKVEHPRGDPVRDHGYSKNGVGLWWKVIGRNKRTVTCYLGSPAGQELFRKLIADADVLIEGFRPGTLERWNLAPTELQAINPQLTIIRVSGFGQIGPDAPRPGFGTLAEGISGFAHVNGQPDGPPTLPPFGLADAIASIAGSVAAMMALYHRDARGGTAQVVDLALIDPVLHVLGCQPTVYDQMGIAPMREGSSSMHNAPRNVYQCGDGKWVAISTSAQAIAERVLRLVGHPEVIDQPWFATGSSRAAHRELLDRYVGDWIAARPRSEVIAAFEQAQAAVAPIYDAGDLLADRQYQARESITTLEDPELGMLRLQNVMFRMSATPGAVRFAGRPIGADNAEVYGALGIDAAKLATLKAQGVI